MTHRPPGTLPLWALALFASAAWSQDGARVLLEPRARPAATASGIPRSDIRVDTNVVLVPVTVTDPMGRVVTALEKEDFRIFEDKVEQRISHFAQEDVALSIGILFDSSGSMKDKLREARRAVAQFLRTANPDDEFFLIEFNDRSELVQNFTSQAEVIQNRLLFTQAKGQTALLDAVYLALDKMKTARHPRKAVLIISDGGDNSSRYTETDVKRRVRESDLQIYAMGIFGSSYRAGAAAEELAGPGLLNQLAEDTGGRAFAVQKLHDLPDIAAKIGVELRNQYVLGYTPANQERDGKYRKVQVKVIPPRHSPPLKILARPGYIAPGQ